MAKIFIISTKASLQNRKQSLCNFNNFETKQIVIETYSIFLSTRCQMNMANQSFPNTDIRNQTSSFCYWANCSLNYPVFMQHLKKYEYLYPIGTKIIRSKQIIKTIMISLDELRSLRM